MTTTSPSLEAALRPLVDAWAHNGTVTSTLRLRQPIAITCDVVRAPQSAHALVATIPAGAPDWPCPALTDT